MSEDDLIINESFPDIQSTSSLLDEASALNRTFSELNLLDGDSNVSSSTEVLRTGNAVIMSQFFKSLEHMGKEEDNDRLPNDLELSQQSNGQRLRRVLTETDWRANRTPTGAFSFSEIDYTEYDPLLSDAELRQQAPEEIQLDASHQETQLCNTVLNTNLPKASSSSGQTLHSVLEKLKTLSSRAHLASKHLNIDFSNASFISDLAGVIHKLSDSRSSRNFFVWVMQDQIDQEHFYVNVVEESSGKILGSVCINEKQFEKARAEGVFDKFLSILLIESTNAFRNSHDQ